MKPYTTGWALAAMAMCTLAWAHGTEDHSDARGPVHKEQKAWGIAGDARSVQRTIQVSMGDSMRFVPDAIQVRRGETVKFVLRNAGQLMHEFVLGTRKELEAHAALMVKFPNMEHAEPYMAHVPPGQTAVIVWTFNRPGAFEFACLIAGHFQAGMIGTLTVSER